MQRPPVRTIADELFFVTVLIEAVTAHGISTGTGFLIQYPNDSLAILVLITNKHVFAGATEVTFSLVGSADGEPTSSPVRFKMDKFDSERWMGHPDPRVDIASMFFTPVVQGLTARNEAPFFRAFLPPQLLTADGANDLDSIEQVTFVGYPSGLFDTKSRSPIARRGHTATPIFNDYNGLPAFVIDGSVFPGSSGSPVVLYDRGYTDRQGTTHLKTRFALLGVLAAVHTRRVTGRVEPVAAAAASFDDPIDLGIVFKASAIQECVAALFKAAHITWPLSLTDVTV